MPSSPKPKSRIYYFGVTIDYKYRQIMSGLDVDYIPTNYVGLLKGIFKKKCLKEEVFVHLRYLMFRGYLLTFPIYALLLLLCKLRGVKVVWSCHNIYEHDIPSKLYGDLMRNLVARFAYRIIVFHPALVRYISRYEGKVRIANFGAFKPFIKSNDLAANADFLTDYEEWLAMRELESADIVFVGEYKGRKNIEFLIEFSRQNPDINILIIANKTPRPSSIPENLYLHSAGKVFGELDTVFSKPGLIGFVAHDNLSVPTGIHLYADYQIPFLGKDIEPVSSFIRDFGCGALFSDMNTLRRAYDTVRSNYDACSAGMEKLQIENSWARSRHVHAGVFHAEEL